MSQPVVLSSISPLALTKTTGMPWVCPSDFSCLKTSYPSISGIMMSSRIRSGGLSASGPGSVGGRALSAEPDISSRSLHSSACVSHGSCLPETHSWLDSPPAPPLEPFPVELYGPVLAAAMHQLIAGSVLVYVAENRTG